MSDLEILNKLNEGYIRSVQASDIKWFGEMLAEDFLNTNPDGSLVDKAAFLRQIEPKAAISNLECHEIGRAHV